MDFKSFKKDQAKLKDAVAKMAQPAVNSYADDRFWSPTKDKVGNANATIRFMSQKDPSDSPIILTFRHAFQTEGRWFIEECPHTIGEKCPVCEQSSAIWNNNEDEARKLWRTKSYIANILVVKDEDNPENDGKVFMYKFGKKIYDMVMDRVAPEDDDEEGVNVFDFDEGLDFKLKLRQVAGYNNYDKSSFAFKTSAIAGGKVKLQEAIYNSLHALAEFVKPDRFKNYDQLLAKFTGSKNASKVPDIQSDFAKEATKEIKVEKEPEPFDPDVEDSDTKEDDIDFDKLLAD